MASEAHPSLLYLWDKRTVYIGPLFEPLDLSQGAATLVLALDKPITFTTAQQGAPVECRSLLLPPGHSVTIDTRDSIVVNCNLDVIGCDFFVLSRLMQCDEAGVAYQLSTEDTFVAGFWHIYQSQMGSLAAYEYVNRTLSIESSLIDIEFTVDQRVVKVIDLIKQRIDDNLPVEELAETVNLSVPRLLQLFKQQTGVPIRRYRLWHRLYVAAVRMGSGESLTQAAIAAGFTDSSHFSHTFRAMLGMKPSYILSQPNRIKIIVSEKI